MLPGHANVEGWRAAGRGEPGQQGSTPCGGREGRDSRRGEEPRTIPNLLSVSDEREQDAEHRLFYFGTTSAAVQVEGVHPAADWSAWERDSLAPRSADGNGFLTNYVDDLGLIASLGARDVRLTIEWARIEPRKDKVDAAALDRYDDIVRHAAAVGLRPWLTLSNSTLPGWFADDEGGFADERSREYLWLRHVDRCAERFADIAFGWTPIEDPIGWAIRGHLLASRPPGKRGSGEFAQLRFLEMVEGALIADHLAARHLRAGGALTMASRGTPTVFRVVDDPTSQLEADAAADKVRWWAQLLHDTWVGMAANGELVAPGRAAQTDAEWVADFDVLGVGFDHPIGVDANGALRPYPTTGLRTDSGFCPLPEELGVQLGRLSDRLLGHRLAVSSNGISTTDDGRRTEVLGETLDIIEACIEDGLPIAGYFHDTAIDGYEWRSGFSTERGLINRNRSRKDSADLFAERARRIGQHH